MVFSSFGLSRTFAANKTVRGIIHVEDSSPSSHVVTCEGSEGTCYTITEDQTTVLNLPGGPKTVWFPSPPPLTENNDGTFTQVGAAFVIEIQE